MTTHSGSPTTEERLAAPRTTGERVAVALEAIDGRLERIESEQRDSISARLFRCVEQIIATKGGLRWLFLMFSLALGFAAGVLAARNWYEPTTIQMPTSISPTSAGTLDP